MNRPGFSGLHYSEDYIDPGVWKYSAAASTAEARRLHRSDRYFEYRPQVRPEGHHGEAFHYRTVNADMAGWAVARLGHVGREAALGTAAAADGHRAGGLHAGGRHRHALRLAMASAPDCATLDGWAC
ncbi:hypothetical protein CNR27_08825 [Luteimonas chenhongjianii]|uniref:Uncharacterized protein n=1 Tax=Luteimonas chenhongjianii TaxID=2006110 RepID=A0A290XEF9_9GAMM|nr:hypothetical protein [Luteimonas chenhongjianii]ATD67525.1 hypothetical protein CNR27_08825 [Luteimonas chenhongjianii]